MNIIKNFKHFTKINEGTWSLPDNTKAAHDLVNFLNANETIPYTDENIKKLHNLIGDDSLYDNFERNKEDIKIPILSFIDDFISYKDFHIKNNDVDSAVFDILKTVNIPENLKAFYKHIS